VTRRDVETHAFVVSAGLPIGLGRQQLRERVDGDLQCVFAGQAGRPTDGMPVNVARTHPDSSGS
jgi:hypothetical protein